MGGLDDRNPEVAVAFTDPGMRCPHYNVPWYEKCLECRREEEAAP